MIDVEPTPYGRAATSALARAISKAKVDRPLRRVTVVVPSNFAGLAARRALAQPPHRGIANVSFVTPFRLAELIAADADDDGRPALTNPVLGAAVRRMLAEQPGPYAAVARHHATERSLAALYAELSQISDAAMDAVRADRTGVTAADAVATIRTHIASFSDERATAEAALRVSAAAEELEQVGYVIWYLPQPTRPALVDVLRSVLATNPSSVVVGLTGDDAADRAVRRVCTAAGVDVPDTPVEPCLGTKILSVTDTDEEVRAVVRHVAALAASGVRLDRIGVFVPVAEPYQRTLRQQFDEAGIPANGPSPERLASSVAGRTLIAALDLPGENWRRDLVLQLASSIPLRDVSPGEVAAWERVSRTAGVVGGLTDWMAKLAGYGERLERRIATTGKPPLVERLERERDAVGTLRAFVGALAEHLGEIDDAAGWADTCDAALRLLRHLVGDAEHRAGWPDDEQRAADQVEAALARLSDLDPIEPEPSPGVIRRAVRAELDVSRSRHGRYGDGVVFGPLSTALGQDLDAVFVLGMTEGLCPAPRGDDAALPDRVRALAGGELALRTDQLDEQHRLFLAALAAAPATHRVLVHPRGDLRGGRDRLPSRWLLPTATALAGTRVRSTGFNAQGPPIVDVVASFASGLQSGPTEGTVAERDLAVVARWVDAGGRPSTHPATVGVRSGLHAMAARRSPAFTAYDGNLAGHDVPSPATGAVLAPTSLESWAQCGFRYFLGHVLHVEARDDPERILELGALDRGLAVHAVLENFLREAIASGPPAPDQPWSDEHRQHLRNLADDAFDQLEATGRSGRRLQWQLERADLHEALQHVLTVDDLLRHEQRATPERAEADFGFGGSSPVSVELADGRSVSFRGRADRIDRTADGEVVVIDYKTGRGAKYRDLAEDDPVAAGTALQLGVYAEAARQQLGSTRPRAEYRVVGEADPYGYPWTDDRRERFISVVETIVDGVEAGVFDPVPGEYDSWRRTHDNCRYCDFDSICPRDRGEHAEAKAGAPELAVRARLTTEDADA